MSVVRDSEINQTFNKEHIDLSINVNKKPSVCHLDSKMDIMEDIPNVETGHFSYHNSLFVNDIPVTITKL